jgi:hypothetical protein
MDFWALKLRSARLEPGDEALGDGIDKLATALDEISEARGPRVSCNAEQRWVQAHFFVSADDFADAVRRGVTTFEHAVANASLTPLPLARVEVARLATQTPETAVRVGVSSHTVERVH